MNAKQTIEAGKAILGIEFGSTRIKAVLIDEDNKPIAQGSHEWENQLVDGLWTYSTEAVWYGLQDCYADLRKAVADKLKRENGLDYAPSEIVVSNGAKQGVCNAVLALVDEGEEVIIPAPYWVSYPQMVLLAGGKPVILPAGFEQNFKITPEQLEQAITPRTRMLILCSPSNPTGSVYSKEELQGLAEVILRHDELYVLADEIYEHINYVGHHESIAQFPGMKERTIVVNGVSKAYAMTGWRIGYIAAPEWIAKGCNKLQGQYTSGPCSVSQKAAEAAYTLSQGCVEEMR